MPRRTKTTFAASAVKDLEEIRLRYAEQQVPAAGDKLLIEVLSIAERLATFPESGRIVQEFGMSNLREVIHLPFRIVYRVDKGRVRIVRVWRSERLLKMP